MSRHNRRRTRHPPNHNHPHNHKPSPSSSSHSEFHAHQYEGFASLPSFSPIAPEAKISAPRYPSRRNNDISAKHWHNRYLAWQSREKKQREERERLREEERRIFGGEEGEWDGDECGDGGLARRMLEFFGGLDFLET
ncbi:hypothetical protein JMJ35_005666 [Cladonia borealis]|uniref:Uncharacterized protein n=1 Tax=Cladonia borealis TaxID=184061 RepID=A0AA39R0H8_9LECA|nr:hypothetical protein JMJ35_005666 [Cladonia borealis]